MQNSSATAKMYLGLARNNIEQIKAIQRLYGISYCCVNALEKRQRELEFALANPVVANSNGNLGFAPVVIAGMAIGSWLASLGVFAMWQYRHTKVELEKQENIKYAMENGLDPSTFCPADEPSATDKLINVVKTAIMIGAVAMGFVIVSKTGIFKKIKL